VVTFSGIATIQGRPSLNVRGRPLPAADVVVLLGGQAPPLRSRPHALVIAVPDRRVAVVCDALLGEEEVVVKPLGPLLAGVPGYLGAAILGDGRVALLAEPATLARGRPEAAARPVTVRPAEARKILVVEDSFTVRELQRSILEAAGYQVATARDGSEALRILGRDASIALVITDVEMPELDGLGLTRAIRADPAPRKDRRRTSARGSRQEPTLTWRNGASTSKPCSRPSSGSSAGDGRAQRADLRALPQLRGQAPAGA
jgi:two-component system chemotaxis sensor kinase CheA